MVTYKEEENKLNQLHNTMKQRKNNRKTTKWIGIPMNVKSFLSAAEGCFLQTLRSGEIFRTQRQVVLWQLTHYPVHLALKLERYALNHLDQSLQAAFAAGKVGGNDTTYPIA